VNSSRPFPMRTRIKFCGITRAEDLAAAAACGADAVGLVLVPESPRALSLEAAQALRQRLPPFVCAVALLRNPSAAAVRETLQIVRPDLLQFHGEEPEEFCAGFGVPYIKAIPMHGDLRPVLDRARAYRSATALLLDGHAPGELGGRGRGFDWGQAAGAFAKPMILAGGLDAQNVAAAILALRPYAVDVSSGIEAGTPGVKDSGKMAAFARAVARADARLTQ
jgi:phosphoribosylanthranilate isomerase